MNHHASNPFSIDQEPYYLASGDEIDIFEAAVNPACP